MTKFSYFLGSEQWQPEDLIKHAEIARESGFDMLTISEHFHPWVDDYSASNFTWTTLGALANKLPELDLGTGVTTPLWRIHPGVIAQAAATVDRLSPSTFHLGVANLRCGRSVSVCYLSISCTIIDCSRVHAIRDHYFVITPVVFSESYFIYS